jgi:hypothetical protein
MSSSQEFAALSRTNRRVGRPFYYPRPLHTALISILEMMT